jgi:hypothetical protein
MTEPLICTCQILDAPGLHEDFGGGVKVQVQVLKIDPECAVHTGPPNPLCRACTDDDGSCTCTKPCGAVTCTGGF